MNPGASNSSTPFVSLSTELAKFGELLELKSKLPTSPWANVRPKPSAKAVGDDDVIAGPSGGLIPGLAPLKLKNRLKVALGDDGRPSCVKLAKLPDAASNSLSKTLIGPRAVIDPILRTLFSPQY